MVRTRGQFSTFELPDEGTASARPARRYTVQVSADDIARQPRSGRFGLRRARRAINKMYYLLEKMATGHVKGQIFMFVCAGAALVVGYSEAWLQMVRHFLRSHREGFVGDETGRLRWRTESYWTIFNGMADPGNVGHFGGARGDATQFGTIVARGAADSSARRSPVLARREMIDGWIDGSITSVPPRRACAI